MLLAVPFSAVGAVWFLYLLGYNMSIGVWVGLIALLGVDAETGVFMLLYLDLAYAQAKKEGRLRSLADLQQAIRYGAVRRLRPKFMTVATMFLGLMPIMWSTGAGADVMKRIAAPMIGGIFTSFLLGVDCLPAHLPDMEVAFRLEKTAPRKLVSERGETDETKKADVIKRVDGRKHASPKASSSAPASKREDCRR